MMDMGPIVLQESIIAKIIWSLLGSLELEGSNASFMPLEGSKEATTNDRGLSRQRNAKQSRQEARTMRCPGGK